MPPQNTQDHKEDKDSHNKNHSSFRRLRTLTGHDGVINRIAWSPVKNELASTSFDRTVQIWDVSTRETARRELIRHHDWVSSVAWSPDGRVIASSSGDNTIRLTDTINNQPVGVLTGHTRTIFDVDWSVSSNVIASASGDASIGLWSPDTRELLYLLRGHSNSVYCVAWAPNGRSLASGSEDHTIRIWDAAAGSTRRILEGHNGAIYAVAWSPDGTTLASASEDNTVRIWGRRSAQLEGHTGVVSDVSFSPDGNFLASKSLDGTIRIWRCDTWQVVDIINEMASRYWTAGLAFHPKQPVLATLGSDDTLMRIWRYDPTKLRDATPVEQTVRYTNAKVVLVGDSGVGKSSLADVLRHKPFQPTESTHARQVYRFHTEELFISETESEVHEILLWDMAGQPGYRLIHQLHLNKVALGLIMFDVVSENDPFVGVRHWDRALRQAQSLNSNLNQVVPLKTFLVAGRTDRAGLDMSRERIDKIVRDMKFDAFFPTSSRDNHNVVELSEAIRNAIDWDALPKVSSTRLFQRIKNFLNDMREEGKLLHTVDQLYDTFCLRNREELEDHADLRVQFETCLGLVDSQGLVKRFSFGNLILLQPEIVDAYASAIITAAKEKTGGMGAMAEEDARAGRFRMSQDERIADKAQEELLLIATVEDLIGHEIAVRDEDDGMVNLVFPSQSTRSYPHRLPEPDANTAIWEFQGPVLNIYTTMLVRLWNTGSFKYKDMYENAAHYTDDDGLNFLLYLQHREAGEAELTLFSDKQSTGTKRLYLEEFINAHLQRRVLPDSLNRRYVIACARCGTAMSDVHVEKRRELNFDYMNCPICENRVSLAVSGGSMSGRQSLLRQRMVRRLDQQADDSLRRQMAASTIQGKRAVGAFDLFLCHNHDDRPQVEKIAEEMEANAILPWLDIRELTGGESWTDAVERQLQTTKKVAFFLGDSGPGKTQLQELQYAITYEATIIPILLPDAPRKPKFPLLLMGKHWVDFRKEHPDPIDEIIRAILGDEDETPEDLK